MANESTWYGGTDYALSDTSSLSNVAKSHMWALKAYLQQQIAPLVAGPAGAIPGGAAWTCVGSSDSATAALDGTDRWLSAFDATKIVRASSGAHSWIVLQSPAALGPYYLTIDWLSGSDQQAVWVIAKVAPTGGTTSLRPTSTNEAAFAAINFTDSGWTSGGGKAHFTTDANGNFWFFASKTGSGLIKTAVGVSKITDLRISGDLFPVCLIVDYNTSGALREGSSTFYAAGSSGVIRTRDSSASTTAVATAVSYSMGGNSVAVDMAAVHYGDSKYDGFPVLVYSVTAAIKGLKGRIPDLRTVSQTVLAGDRSPPTGDVEQICVGNTLVPLTAVPTL